MPRSDRRPSLKCRLAAALLPIGFLLAISDDRPALASGCAEQVRRLADDYGLSAELPGVEAPLSSDELARSGGVVEPPRVDESAVIEPSDEPRYAMPTLPDVNVEATESEGGGALSPEDTTTLETMLVGARAEAERGDEKGCFERLQQARRFIDRQHQE